MLGLRHGLAVGVDYVVDDADSLAGQAHAALHEVLTAVDGAEFDFAEDFGVGGDVFAAVFFHQ